MPVRAQLYTYQLCRSLAYIHSLGVCHRDIKPQNLLVHPETHLLKLCDFGSAKILVKGEPNVSYICSRYYRAPELIFGATDYTCCIDVWSVGCVLAELLLGVPLFPGESGVDQLVEIIKVCLGRARLRAWGGGGADVQAGERAACRERKTRPRVAALPTLSAVHVLQVLGTPTLEEIQAMNQNYTEYKFPQARRRQLEHATSAPTLCTRPLAPLHPPPRSFRRSSRTRGTRSSAPARRRTPSSWSRVSCATPPTPASSPSRVARCLSSTSCATKACSSQGTAPLRLCSILSRRVRGQARR